MRVIPLLLIVTACLNTRRADVRLPDNAAGADCFDRCILANQDTASEVDCVAACPMADTDSGSCGDRKACVEHRTISKGKTALVMLGVAAIFAAGGR